MIHAECANCATLREEIRAEDLARAEIIDAMTREILELRDRGCEMCSILRDTVDDLRNTLIAKDDEAQALRATMIEMRRAFQVSLHDARSASAFKDWCDARKQAK